MSSTGQSPDEEPGPKEVVEGEVPPVIDVEASEVREPPAAEDRVADGPPERSAESAPPPQADAPRRRDVGYVAAGLIAALLAGLAIGYGIYQVATAPNRDAIATLDDRVAALEKRLADNVSRSDEMAASLNGVRGELQRLAAQPRSQPDAAVGDRLTRVEQGMGETRNAIEDLRKSLAERAQAPTAAAPETQAAIDQLKQRVGEIDAKLAEPPPPPAVPPEIAQKIDDLGRQLKDTQAEVKAPKGPPPAPPAGAAFAALLAKVESGEPYGAALDQMVGQLPDAPGIEALRAAASEGVPTMDELRTSLENITASLNAGAPEPHEGLFGALMNRLSSVVRVRRSGELDWGAAAAKALEALKAGNLADAVSILGQGANPPDQIATWLKGARARLQVEAALATLSTAVLRHISGSQT